MKKFLISTPFLFSSLVAPSFAEESKNFYLSIGGGFASVSDVEGDYTYGSTKYDATLPTDDIGVYTFALGKEFKDWRVEFNYGISSLNTESITVTSGGATLSATITPQLELDVKSYMLYGYKDFNKDEKFKPYIGLGLGYASLSAKDQVARVSGTRLSLKGAEESVFSYAIKGGTAYELSDKTSLFAEVVYQNLSSLSIESAGYNATNYDSTDFVALVSGLKFKF